MHFCVKVILTIMSSKKALPLTTDEYELLLQFEKNSTVKSLAEAVAKDPSVVSRLLNRISHKHPVVAKKNGQWFLTDLGKQLNQKLNYFIFSQTALLNTRRVIRIGTNTEFSAKILSPRISQLQEHIPNTQFHIMSFQNGTEDALLNNEIDLSIDCDRPYSADISYKLVIDEPLAAIVGKKFFQKYKKQIQDDQLYELPHLLCERLYPDKILLESSNRMTIAARFNDVASTRAACVADIGWALLPIYTVKSELKDGDLIDLHLKTKPQSKYGVWFLRDRTELKSVNDKLINWLKHQSLS